MRIRRFRKEDARKVSTLIKQNLLEVNTEYSEATTAALLSQTTPSKLIERSKERNYYVAVEKGRILGIGGYREDAVHTFFVRPDCHGQGIGTQLLTRVLQDAKAEGIKTMHAASTRHAEQFYASFGFTRIDERTAPYFGTTLRFVRMEKRLT